MSTRWLDQTSQGAERKTLRLSDETGDLDRPCLGRRQRFRARRTYEKTLVGGDEGFGCERGQIGEQTRVVLGPENLPSQAWVSAISAAGLTELRSAIAACARPNRVSRRLHLELGAASVRSNLYQRNAVRAEHTRNDGSWDIEVELELAEIDKLLGRPGVEFLDSGQLARTKRVA